MTSRASSYGLVLGAAVIWGLLGPTGAHLNSLNLDGPEVASMRIATTAIILITIFPFAQQNGLIIKGIGWLPVVHSLVGVVAYNISFFYAISTLGITLSVCLLYTSPFWTIIFGKLLLSESINPYRVAISLISVIGVSFVIIGRGNAAPSGFSWVGILAGLASGVCYSLYGVLGKRALNDRMSSTQLLFTSFIVAGLCMLPNPSFWSACHTIYDDPKTSLVLSVLFLSLIGTVLSYFMFTRGLQNISAASASLITPVEPVTAVIVATIYLGERIDPVQVCGIFLIILGAVVGVRFAHPRKGP